MKNLTIYNVYVEMQDQEQCNRMEQLCIDYNLQYWDTHSAFLFSKEEVFSMSQDTKDFFVYPLAGNESDFRNKTKITEQQFIELLKQHKHD